ncbi:MAG: CHAT domain-containing protein [Blastocatellales bacterium]
MEHATRRLRSIIFSVIWAASFCVFGFAQEQSQHSPLSADDQAALQKLAEDFYAAYTQEDMARFIALWSRQSPEREAARARMQQQFDNYEQIAMRRLEVRRAGRVGERARLLLAVEMSAIETKTKRPAAGFGKLLRVMECAREEGLWRVWRFASATDDLATALAGMKTDEERQRALTEAEPELLNNDLTQAVGRATDRLRIRGDMAQALAVLRFMRRWAEQRNDRGGQAAAINSIGVIFAVQADIATATEHFQKAADMFAELGDKQSYARLLNNIALIYNSASNFDQAADYFRRSLEIKGQLGDQAGVAASLIGLGNTQRMSGDWPGAMESYQRSLRIGQTLGVQDRIAAGLLSVGLIHYLHGNYRLALDQFQKALTIREAENNKNSIGILLLNMGNAYREQGDYARAHEHYQKGLAVAEPINARPLIANALNNLGITYHLQGKTDLALAPLQRSLAMREAQGDRLGAGHAHRNLGMVYNQLGQYEPALQSSARAAAIGKELGDHYLFCTARAVAGAVHYKLGQTTQSRQALEEAVAAIEKMREQAVGGATERQQFFEIALSPYHLLVQLHVEQQQFGDAFAYAERAKARALLDVLAGGGARINKVMTAAERDQERKLTGALTETNAQLARAQLAAKPDAARVAELQTKVERARLDFEAFQTALYVAHPELKTQRGEAKPINAAEAARLLPNAATALLEYVVTEEKVFLFVLTKGNGLQVHPLAVTAKNLRARAAAFRQQLARRDPEFSAAARELYDLLLKPAAAQLRGKTALVIIPDGPLWELPFQTLQPAPSRHLIETYTVSYAPSLTALREMTKARNKRPARPATLLAFGNPALGHATVNRADLTPLDEKFGPLPDAEEQVRKLAQIYGPRQSKIYVGAEAREERAKAEAAHHRILHLATHGVLNNTSPLYSHLLLAQTEGDAKEAREAQEDGLLEAWELMKLDLNADLVVLSACETARGRVGAGEGVIGLTWALFVAGCPRTVVSQWKVESASTTELMVEFHQQLKLRMQREKASFGAAQALRAAALKMLRGGHYRHPFYWAGFVVVGDGF